MSYRQYDFEHDMCRPSQSSSSLTTQGKRILMNSKNNKIALPADNNRIFGVNKKCVHMPIRCCCRLAFFFSFYQDQTRLVRATGFVLPPSSFFFICAWILLRHDDGHWQRLKPYPKMELTQTQSQPTQKPPPLYRWYSIYINTHCCCSAETSKILLYSSKYRGYMMVYQSKMVQSQCHTPSFDSITIYNVPCVVYTEQKSLPSSLLKSCYTSIRAEGV